MPCEGQLQLLPTSQQPQQPLHLNHLLKVLFLLKHCSTVHDGCAALTHYIPDPQGREAWVILKDGPIAVAFGLFKLLACGATKKIVN